MNDSSQLQNRLGYQFQNLQILKLALTHKSYIYENKYEAMYENDFYNERLEFLGDSILQMVITKDLYLRFPHDSEGVLSKKRSALVNEAKLHEIALGLELPAEVLVGRGEKKSQGHLRPRLLASTLEALLGAVFLDAGYDKAEKVILQIYEGHLQNISGEGDDYNLDFKTQFQEIVQKDLKIPPTYELVSDTDGKFKVDLKVLDQVISQGEGSSKKQAEQDAARKILGKLKKISFTQFMNGDV